MFTYLFIIKLNQRFQFASTRQGITQDFLVHCHVLVLMFQGFFSFFFPPLLPLYRGLYYQL